MLNKDFHRKLILQKIKTFRNQILKSQLFFCHSSHERTLIVTSEILLFSRQSVHSLLLALGTDPFNSGRGLRAHILLFLRTKSRIFICWEFYFPATFTRRSVFFDPWNPFFPNATVGCSSSLSLDFLIFDRKSGTLRRI